MKIFWLTLICLSSLLFSSETFGWNDSDKDGVPDLKDACPKTPLGVLVDASGCDKNRLFKSVCLKTTEGDIYPDSCSESSELVLNFEFAKSEVLYSQWLVLAQVKQFLQLEDVKLCLIGHTDSVGSLEANQRLSESRASSVKRILVEDYGFAPERFIIKGMGSLTPVSLNDTEVGRALNRRVNFKVVLPN
ncbi:OmpA family protein [Shewanella sp. UCD-KL12]|uniref:OmpA family protein n=1 Tax=Shewanella sp. UCD-KL12 TaxID=1917163 RepID=UPI000970A367|nr:OmpA family protein [Shewanella sp. UCD-KL12]